ncbi:Rxlr effector protein, partial [Globisporangium splendens]
MEQPKEGAARKEAPESVSTKTATALRSVRAQVDADVATRASQHEEGGALDSVHTNDTAQLKAGGQEKIRTIEEGTTPSRAEGSRKEASTETTPVERYEALAAKLCVSPNAVNKVEIEYEVRLMFTALYNGMRILEKPKKANDNYPTLNGEEADALVDLFRLLAIEKGKSFPEWKRTIQDLCKDMHRSSWTVVALIQKRIDQNKLAEETKASPWGSQTSTNSQTKAKEQGTQPFTFKSDKYSEEEQSNMIRHCKQKFEYSVTLRQPTTMEWEIMLAIVEGELLIRHLPQFLRRVCDGDTLFRFQNTIAAQVEGELVGKLSDATQVYKDHQSTGRIVEAILQAARYRNDGKMEETMAMLKDLKAAEYNDSTHSLHFYFFDRSTAAKWNKTTIPFRRQLVQLISAHQTETTGERQEANNVWNRQLGADGLQNAESRSRYKIQLLNTARSMNMALFLEYLKQTTGKRFYAYPLDQYGPRSNQSQWWEVLFEDELCPKALIDVRRIIWRGRTLILHHASKYRIAPCLICGAAGHFARACKATEEELKTNNCIYADDEIVSKLPRKPATFTSAAEIKESVSDSIDKLKQPLQPAAESPQASEENKPSENANPVTPDVTNTSSPQPNSNPRNLTKNASFTVGTGTPVQQIGNLKEQAKAKPNGGVANTKGPVSKASQKNGPRQISKEDIRWAKELMRFRRDMDELMKVHVERQAELNPNRNDIMDWDGEYTLQDVMDANGLAEATTPPTGNCQFYAVAEAMLQITHDNMANEKLLEATASRIKQSMNAAARLNFDLEFPEGTHLGILEALGRGDRKMSPKERKADVLDYFNDIASSSSSRSSTLPGSMWGGPESLRMAAKALQRKVFVLIETTYGNRKGFAIYKPQSRVQAGGQFLSAKEHACTGKQWEDELRQDRIEAEATSSPLPIVMKFAKEHYNSLHFRTLNEPSPLATMTSSSLAKHLQGSERSKTEFKTDRSGQFDFEPVAEDSMEESDNSSLEDLEVTPSLEEREKFEPNQLSGHHGWSFASQENQLVVYHSPTTELPPQPRKRDRDETLMLTAGDGDDAMNLNSPNVPLKKTRTLSRRLAIEGDSMQKRRDLERTLQEHWEGFQEQWKQETKCPFPLLSSNHDVWTQAALNEWERILAMLKTSPGPHHVLNHLRGPTLVDLTQVLREQVIEEGLKRLLYRTDEAETKVWITGWFDRIATAATKQQRAALLNSKEDWSMLGRMKYGGLEVLRLCHPTQQEKLSRYIICTVVYEEELQTFRSSDAEDSDNLYEAIEDFCAILKQTRELKAAFKSGEELSEWSALSVIMAQVTMEVDSVEPSRSCPNTLRVLTQNVCGFKKKERTKWLEDLKGALTAEKYDIIYLQETRITTAKEERRLRQYWNRIWGITNLDEATSFWSIHPDATGGVAILTNPKTISETKLIEESKWTNRTVAIKSKGVVWINVYAPNKKSEREHFFRRLNEEFGTHRAAAVLGGDFNCVLDKQRDRTEKISDGVEHTRRTGASGGSGVASAARTDGTFHILEKKLSQSTRPILYSRKSGKRRAMGGHRATQALLGSPSSGAAYEMDEPTAETKEGEQVQAISRELELMQSEGPIEWSHLEQRIIKAILRVSRAEKRQVRRYQQKLEDQQHQPVKRSRRQLIEEQANAAREAAEFKFGKYMQATQGDVRHFFRRIANWQRDQTISRLEPTPGRYHPPNVSLADIMGAEWHQITGQSHATVPPHKAELRFDALVYIPETRKVTEAQNQDLMAPITEKEVREAIAALHRHKAGGVDSLNNDFYKDCEDAMVDVLVREFNNIQHGAPMPRSFGQGIVIPLRKKGDSPNPLDYRPITLLTTTYKLFAKVLATRLQDILLWIIGEEQQGFVRDRLMENAILIMQAALDKAYHSSTEGFDDATGIVMLDFMKAYDTLDRGFLYLVLSKFGFGRQFVDLVRRMHTDTTAQYLVNGELSREWEVKSGIRQGCPLAPLLFIVAAEILALAVQQDPYLEGIRVTKSGAEPHLISTFVDDSAVFLKQGRQLPRLMQLLTEFGQQSGLHVQPTKSSYISLNTAVVQEQRCGIPILKHGETVRYLGIQIGTGNITQANWEDRLQKLRTRLIIATKVSNSVVGRVLILNSVLLPSILFTAGYIKPPAKVVDQLVNLQKQFLWKSTLGTDGMRHKVSPSLLYLPVKEGGIGLYSIPLAIKRQAMRRTTRWLQRARDRYTEAWHEQVHQDKSQNWGCCAISPKERSQHAQARLYQTNNIHRLGWEYLGEDLVAAEGRNPAWKDDLKRQMESLLPTVDLEWRSDGRVGVYFGRKPEQTIHQLSEETRAFWPSFQWNDNPWIIDSQGGQYTVKTVPFLKECNLGSFNVRREEERVFSVRLPTMMATLTSKRRAVLRKLVTSIILCSPEIEIDVGSQLISQQEPWSRKPTKREYKWISNGMGTIIAMPGSERSHTDYIQMQRQANGVLWTVTDWTGDATCQQDVAMIEEEIKTVGWTFKPHPLTTHCPWLVHECTPPNSIQKTIDRARTRRLHSKLYQGLGVLVDKLNEVAKTDQWYSHVQYRLPADLWKQRGCLTPYQMWTTYRISTMQLNLFHPGRSESSACPSNAGCGETKETISHILWSCKRAQAAWMAFLGRWIGRTLTEQALNLFLPHIASRSAPPGQRSLLRELEKSFGFITPEHSTALQKLWFIVTSSIPVLLWRTRVEIVHERQHVAIEESTKRVWTACVMQVRAVAHRMRALKGEKINATCLSQLLSVLERQDLSRQLEAWATARLYFDGGARGNPGPGGSGWALIFLNERSNRWELKACGYAYMGPEVTNNWCEYSALKDGLAYSAHYLQHYEVKLEVFGDSQMIIAAQNGFSSIRQTKLQPLAVRVNQIIANFAWTSWNHTKREPNKMTDLLANMAMNSKSAKILTDESRGNDQILMSQVAALLDNDIGATPSKLRNTSLQHNEPATSLTSDAAQDPPLFAATTPRSTSPPLFAATTPRSTRPPAVFGPPHRAHTTPPAVCCHHTAPHKPPSVCATTPRRTDPPLSCGHHPRAPYPPLFAGAPHRAAQDPRCLRPPHRTAQAPRCLRPPHRAAQDPRCLRPPHRAAQDPRDKANRLCRTKTPRNETHK